MNAYESRGLRLLTWLVLLLLIDHVGTALCQNRNQPQRITPDACRYSDQIYNGDGSLMLLPKAPTRFRLMVSRYVGMVQTHRGFPCTGTATVGFDGHSYVQTGRSDDPGMIELIPTVSRFLGISLANAYDLTMLAVIAAGIFIGYGGFWLLYPERRSRVIGAAVFLCIAIAEAAIADEYAFQISPLIAGIPWLLYLAHSRKNLALTACATLLGFCCSWCSIVRSGSLVICMTFLLTLIAARRRIQKPFLPILFICLSCVPALLFERALIARRDFALARFGETARAVNSHPLWHTLYIGLGFIPNSEVPEYRDGVAGEKVRSIDPTVAYTSARYQAILRHELWGIVKRRPMLVLGIFAAKTAIVILLALILLYPARRLILVDRSVLWLDAPFLLTIGVSAMNGIVAVPRASYLLTFLCLTFLYTAIKLCGGVDHQGTVSRVSWNV